MHTRSEYMRRQCHKYRTSRKVRGRGDVSVNRAMRYSRRYEQSFAASKLWIDNRKLTHLSSVLQSFAAPIICVGFGNCMLLPLLLECYYSVDISAIALNTKTFQGSLCHVFVLRQRSDSMRVQAVSQMMSSPTVWYVHQLSLQQLDYRTVLVNVSKPGRCAVNYFSARG